MNTQDFNLIKVNAFERIEMELKMDRIEEKLLEVSYCLEINCDRLIFYGFKRGDRVYLKKIDKLEQGAIICMRTKQGDYTFRKIKKENGTIFLEGIGIENMDDEGNNKPDILKENERKDIIGQALFIMHEITPGTSFTQLW